MRHMKLLFNFIFIFNFNTYSQDIIYTDTINKYEIFVEMDGAKITFFAKYDDALDTVWNNGNGAIPISRINYVNIFDEDKFVIIYTCLSSYYYVILTRGPNGWGESGMAEHLSYSPPRNSAKVTVIDATTVRIQQNNTLTKVSFNLETKSCVRRIIPNEKF